MFDAVVKSPICHRSGCILFYIAESYKNYIGSVCALLGILLEEILAEGIVIHDCYISCTILSEKLNATITHVVSYFNKEQQIV